MASNPLVYLAGILLLAGCWLVGLFVLGDPWGAVPIIGGTVAFLLVFTWPAVSTWVRGFGDARRAAEATAAGRVGEAVVERLAVGSLRVNGARLVELHLVVREPGRAEFRTRVRTLVDEFFASQVQPGAVLRVGRPRADRDEVVLLP